MVLYQRITGFWVTQALAEAAYLILYRYQATLSRFHLRGLL